MKLKLDTMMVKKKFALDFVVTHDKYLLRFRWYYSTGSYAYSKPRYTYESNSGLKWEEQSRWVAKELAEADAARWELIHLGEKEKKSRRVYGETGYHASLQSLSSGFESS